MYLTIHQCRSWHVTVFNILLWFMLFVMKIYEIALRHTHVNTQYTDMHSNKIKTKKKQSGYYWMHANLQL